MNRSASRSQRALPGVRTTDDLDEVLADPTVDAVSIATPPATHYPLSSARLRRTGTCSWKSRSPPAWRTPRSSWHWQPSGPDSDAGPHFLYSPAVNKVRELIDSGELGEIYFVTSSRMNLGIYSLTAWSTTSPARPVDPSVLDRRPVTMVAASDPLCSRTEC